MRRTMTAALVAVIMGLGVLFANPAQAQDWGWEGERMPSYRICVEDHTTWTGVYRVPYSVKDWNTTDLDIIWRFAKWGHRCPDQYVKNGWVIRVYEWGGKWAAGYQVTHDNWREIRLSRYWFARYNLNDRQHIVSHEFGHAFGLGHNYGIWSIMTDDWPAPLSTQRIDRAAINARY